MGAELDAELEEAAESGPDDADQRDGATHEADRSRRGRSQPEHEPRRRYGIGRHGPQVNTPHYLNWGAVLLLQVVTCGLYGPYWLVRTRSLFDGLGSRRKLNRLPILVVVLTILTVAVGIVEAIVEEAAGGPSVGLAGNLFSIIQGLVTLAALFRARAILLDHLRPRDITYRLSAAGTFFFGVIYLQYALNQLTEADLRPGAAELVRVFE